MRTRKFQNLILFIITIILLYYLMVSFNILSFLLSFPKILPFTIPVLSQCTRNYNNISDVLSLDQTDQCVSEFIRKNHLVSPPTYCGPNPNVPFTRGTEFSKIIYKLFKQKKTGTFVEVGAHDGVSASNSLFLEQIGWTGLLIECNPLLLPKLKKTNRKAWIADVCLSTISKPQIVNFTTLKEWPAAAQLWKPPPESDQKKWGFDKFKDPTWYYYQIPAFPLYSILMATQSFSEIDYLSLDVQGIELQVFKNFPFKNFVFKAIITEVYFYNSTERKEVLLIGHGYKLWKTWEHDFAFVHQSLEVT